MAINAMVRCYTNGAITNVTVLSQLAELSTINVDGRF
jgi:hypothetical protein